MLTYGAKEGCRMAQMHRGEQFWSKYEAFIFWFGDLGYDVGENWKLLNLPDVSIHTYIYTYILFWRKIQQ